MYGIFMKNLDKIAEDLFNKIRGKVDSIEIGDDEGKSTTDPSAARFYSFKYNIDGTNDIPISVALFDNKLSVLYNQSIIKNMDQKFTQSWYDFLYGLRIFAKKRLLSFDTRDIKKTSLKRRDYKFLSQDTQVVESKNVKTTRRSFQKIGDSILKIIHSRPINIDTANPQLKNVESIFIESSNGERFRYPYKNINGARAMARHVNEGGTPYDEFGQHIVKLNEELLNLNKFKRYTKRSHVMAEGLSEYIELASSRISNVKKELKKIQSLREYKKIIKNFDKIILEDLPETLESSWVDQLTIKHFNEELKDVFPYVYRLVSESLKPEVISPTDFFKEFDE